LIASQEADVLITVIHWEKKNTLGRIKTWRQRRNKIVTNCHGTKTGQWCPQDKGKWKGKDFQKRVFLVTVFHQ